MLRRWLVKKVVPYTMTHEEMIKAIEKYYGRKVRDIGLTWDTDGWISSEERSSLHLHKFPKISIRFDDGEIEAGINRRE